MIFNVYSKSLCIYKVEIIYCICITEWVQCDVNCRLSRRESRPIWRNTRSRSGKPSGNRKRRKNDRGGQLHSVMQLHYAIKLCATNKNRKDMWKSNKKTKQKNPRKISREANDTLFTEQQHLVQISNDINLAFVALFQAFFFLQWQSYPIVV